MLTKFATGLDTYVLSQKGIVQKPEYRPESYYWSDTDYWMDLAKARKQREEEMANKKVVDIKAEYADDSPIASLEIKRSDGTTMRIPVAQRVCEIEANGNNAVSVLIGYRINLLQIETLENLLKVLR
jgi:hypothetical protein